MLSLPTVILEHAGAPGRHFDWLLAPPPGHAHPEARLSTYRVGVSPRAWSADRLLHLTELAPHRRFYLTYQGPVRSRGGWVRRVASGAHRPRVWTGSRRVLELDLSGLVGEWVLERTGGSHWVGRWVRGGG